MENRSSRWDIEEVEPETPKPEWFEWAVSQRPSSNQVTVDNCKIHYLKWTTEKAEKPGILFVHGGAAHAQWWSFIAPFFAKDRPVAAIDLSGMGDSSRREEYTNAHRVSEMAAVIEDAGLGPKPVVVGHSFGGTMTMCFCGKHSSELSGAVIVDSFVRPPRDDDDGPRRSGRPKPYFPDKATIARRYRLSPYQACDNEFIVEHIAQHSVIEEERGWTWKYDDGVRGRGTQDEPLADYLRNMNCPKALFYGEESVLLSNEVLAFTSKQFGGGDYIIPFPASGHHLMLDQPIGFIAALRAVFAGWGV